MRESGFTKLFSSIVTSTIWQENDQTRIVWITLLALANRYGEVGASLPGIANAANVPLEKAEEAMDKFQKPDIYSRNKANDGRRIRQIEGGWLIINYGLYREKMRSRAEYFRNYRAKKKYNSCATGLTNTRPIAEAEAEAEAEEKNPSLSPFTEKCCICGKKSDIFTDSKNFCSNCYEKSLIGEK